jgi:hypothetical protein
MADGPMRTYLTYIGEQMQIRHSNLLAQARFLYTQAEPKLVRGGSIYPAVITY